MRTMGYRSLPTAGTSSRSRRVVALVLALAVLVVAVAAPRSTEAALPAGFQVSTVFDNLNAPTDMAFAPDGRVFVAEKSGIIKVFDSLNATTPAVFADLRTNVYSYLDRGMLGILLHKDFPQNPYLYVLYTYNGDLDDVAPRWYDPNNPTTDPPCPKSNDGCIVTGRLSRLQVLEGNGSGPEQVLVHDWCAQYYSHSVGSMGFGADGYLYVSGGEGANYTSALGVDYGQLGKSPNVCGDPPVPAGTLQTPPDAQGGALRAQSPRRPAGQPVSLSGSIIRVDPETGAGVPGNPLYGSADPNARRIIAYGLRNPFRITVRPGTNEVWIGDVGWKTWEEINRVAGPTGLSNFGWPCYEGDGRQPLYDDTNLTSCETLYGDVAAEPDAHVKPFYAYNHAARVVSGDGCATGGSSPTGVAFYTGTSYPAQYRGALFFSDYSRQCIWAFGKDAGGNPDPAVRTVFATGAGTAISLRAGPGDDLFFIDHAVGRVRRIRYYTSAQQPPVPVVSADRTAGPAPLAVRFDGSGSYDPDNGDRIVGFAWDLDGDGAFDDSTAQTPTYSYQAAGRYSVRLRVTDSRGDFADSDPVVIFAGESAPVVTISSPSTATKWKVNDTIAFAGGATDGQGAPLPASALRWKIVIKHCEAPTSCHNHELQEFEGISQGSFGAINHDYPSWLELTLTATTPSGLSSSKTIRLDPQAVALTFLSSPPGLPLTVAGETSTTPFNRTVIVGSLNQVSAEEQQWVSGVRHTFASWSDGGARTHEITADPSAPTFVATYQSQAPRPRIITPTRGLFTPGETIAFSGDAVDATGRAIPTPALRWEVVARIGSREQTLLSSSGASGSFRAPTQRVDAIEIRLTASDANGPGAASKLLWPGSKIAWVPAIRR